MSWWTEVSGAVLGDAPADAVRAALAGAVGSDAAPREPRTPTAQLVAAVEVAVQQALGLSDRPRLAARLDAGRRVSAGDAAPDELVAALTAAFERAGAAYRSSLDRDPTPAELAATVAFVLAPVAADALDLPEGTTRLEALEPM